jgi:hypothetical protein
MIKKENKPVIISYLMMPLLSSSVTQADKERLRELLGLV